MKRGGYSYAEVLIALAVFAIALVPLFPAINKLRSDADAAGSVYSAQLSAQELMLIVREATEECEPALARAAEYASARSEAIRAYAYWIVAPDGGAENFSSPFAPDGFDASAEVSNFTLPDSVECFVIVAAVWDFGGTEGRAVGMALR